MNQKDIENIFKIYHSGDITEQEKKNDQKGSLDHLLHRIKEICKRSLWLLVIVAFISLALALSVYYMKINQQQPQNLIPNHNPVNDLVPGGNKAVLTLANGYSIALNGAQNGKLASQGNTIISKTADGQIIYKNLARASSANLYNIVATPRGGNYQMVLADGTKVWLNAASSLKYPVSFSSQEYKVELSGEAYFEVAYQKNKTFLVVSNGQTIEVLGTHFNINAYNDEAMIKTTLMEGSAKIISKGASNIIKPGEQAQLIHDHVNIVTVNTEDEIAWKNGLFNFKEASLETVMKQLSRWYDVDIRYEGKVPDRVFSGDISKNIRAAQLQEILSFKQIHFRVNGKTIIITP